MLNTLTAPAARALTGLTRAPLWQCGFRPFFVGAGGAAVVFALAWAAHLAFGLPLPRAGGSTVLWHGHEMLLGLVGAAVLGFVLTAVPEFTGAPAFGRGRVIALVGLWALGRLAVVLPGGGWMTLALQAALAAALLWMVTPPLWRRAGGRHRDLGWALAAVLAAMTLADARLASGGDVRAALYLVAHTTMALIVVALARISMRMVNRALDERGLGADFLARAPRRQLALLAIGLHAVAHLLAPDAAATGWLALAAAAATLGLLADWHAVPAALTRRWVAMLYVLPWLIAGGYALQGAAALGAGIAPSAGLHLQGLGAIGLAVFAVLNIAGCSHAGEALDERAWVPAAAALIVGAAIVRAAAGVWTTHAQAGWLLAAALWAAAFGLWLWRAAPTLWRERRDGQVGCAGPVGE